MEKQTRVTAASSIKYYPIILVKGMWETKLPSSSLSTLNLSAFYFLRHVLFEGFGRVAIVAEQLSLAKQAVILAVFPQPCQFDHVRMSTSE